MQFWNWICDLLLKCILGRRPSQCPTRNHLETCHRVIPLLLHIQAQRFLLCLRGSHKKWPPLKIIFLAPCWQCNDTLAFIQGSELIYEITWIQEKCKYSLHDNHTVWKLPKKVSLMRVTFVMRLFFKYFQTLCRPLNNKIRKPRIFRKLHFAWESLWKSVYPYWSRAWKLDNNVSTTVRRFRLIGAFLSSPPTLFSLRESQQTVVRFSVPIFWSAWLDFPETYRKKPKVFSKVLCNKLNFPNS